MRDKIIFDKEEKVISLSPSSFLEEISRNQWVDLICEFQFSKHFLEECIRQNWYTIDEVYFYQYIPDEMIEKHVNIINKQFNDNLNSFNYVTNQINIEDFYYYLISSTKPNENYLKRILNKFDRYVGVLSGSPLEYPWQVFFENQYISDDMIQYVIQHYEGFQNEIIDIEKSDLVQDLYLYRSDISDVLKLKHPKIY